MPSFKNSKGANIDISQNDVDQFTQDNGQKDLGRIGDAFTGASSAPASTGAPDSLGGINTVVDQAPQAAQGDTGMSMGLGALADAQADPSTSYAPMGAGQPRTYLSRRSPAMETAMLAGLGKAVY